MASAHDAENALVISDTEFDDSEEEYEPDEIEVQEYIDEFQAAQEALAQAQRRVNELMGLDDNGDTRMTEAPPVVSEAVEMDGVEPSAPQPETISLNGFFQVLGADGFYHQTRYVFTTTTAQAAQLFGRFIPLP